MQDKKADLAGPGISTYEEVEKILPSDYEPLLPPLKRMEALYMVKDYIEKNMAKELNLQLVQVPLIVSKDSGVNDYLDRDGSRTPIEFPCGLGLDKRIEAQVVQAATKWKRMALKQFDCKVGEGINTDMRAVRKDYFLDHDHSSYVDQWDWERIISVEERNLNFLKDIAKKIYSAIVETDKYICEEYPQLPKTFIPEEMHYVHTEELEEEYPNLTSKEREDEACKKYGAIFLIGIGGNLKSGKPHDGRASDYDDWTTENAEGFKGLNGDIIIWNELLNTSMELSSMGIRVDKNALKKQLKIRDEEWKKDLYFHKRLLNDELPLTIGGGIGQSRLCMLMMRKVHIGEVHSAIWTDEIRTICKENNIFLL